MRQGRRDRYNIRWLWFAHALEDFDLWEYAPPKFFVDEQARRTLRALAASPHI